MNDPLGSIYLVLGNVKPFAVRGDIRAVEGSAYQPLGKKALGSNVVTLHQPGIHDIEYVPRDVVDEIPATRISNQDTAIDIRHAYTVRSHQQARVKASNAHVSVVADNSSKLAIALEADVADLLEDGGKGREDDLAGAVEGRIERAVGVVTRQGEIVALAKGRADIGPPGHDDLAVCL